MLGRERERGEVRPDVPVLAAGQHDHLRFGYGPARPADLLVVSDRGLRGTEVHHEPQVGLVETHTKRAGRHQRPDPVGQQVVFGLQPLRRLVAAAVRGDVDSLVAEERRRLVGRGDRQRVDDPGSRPAAVGETGRQPGEPLVGGRQAHHREVQRLPVQRAAQHEHVAWVLARAELLGDVAGDPGVRGRGGRQHRDPRRKTLQQRADPPVVGAEVVAPVGDAVCLVDHDQARRGGELRQHLVAEARIVQAFGADQQHVRLAVRDLRVDVVPLLGVGGVDRARVDPGPARRLDLVAHQREQR